MSRPARRRHWGCRGCYVITSNIPPHRQQPFASAYHRFAMVSFAVADPRRTGGRPDLELRSDGAVVHVADTREVPRARLRAVGAVLRHRRRRVRRNRQRGATTPRSSTRRTSPSCRGPASRSSELPRAAAAAGRAWSRPPLDAVAQIEPLIILIDAPTADVSSTAIRERRRRRRIDRRAGAAGRRSNTLSSTDFTRR